MPYRSTEYHDSPEGAFSAVPGLGCPVCCDNGFMFKMAKLVGLVLCALGLRAEFYTMTLRQAINRALEQNPEIAMARFDELKAREAVRIQKDPFSPHVYFGSGLAYTNGFPMAIEGAAPSVLQGRATQFLFNRQQSYVVARTKEEARGATIPATAKKDDVAYRTALMYDDAERAARVSKFARQEIDSLEKVLGVVQNRVQEGHALPLESKRAEYNLARARQIADGLDADLATAETSLAILLGYSADDRVRPAGEERTVPALPVSEDAAVESALQSSPELRGLESQIVAKGLDARANKAARLPRVDLVAQYGLFAKFNHYQDYFVAFQRNNGEIGASFQMPLLAGPAVSAAAAEAEADAAKLRIQMSNARNRIMADTRQAYREVRKSEGARDVARLDLELAREQLSVNLSLLTEGRILPSQLEELRVIENDKWIAFYDAQYAVERAVWNLSRQTGELIAALR